MKKYIPYIAIPLIIYLVIGFIQWQLNPMCMSKGDRLMIILYSIGGIAIYRLKHFDDKNK